MAWFALPRTGYSPVRHKKKNLLAVMQFLPWTNITYANFKPGRRSDAT
jgi:hypothetical protein